MPNDQYIQNPENVARAKTYQTRALAMFDAGFTSEAARKDALDYLNRAYDVLVKEAINYGLWSQRTDGGDRWVWDSSEAEQLSYKNIPDLHVWKADKHAKLYAEFPGAVKFANVLSADRAAIKAAALVAKKPTKTSIKRDERNAVAKTCQICGRPILAERGNIAHHGYQRPGHGTQTASCYGAMHLPFEISRDVLGTYIKLQQGNLDKLIVESDAIDNETGALMVWYFTGKYNGKHKVMGHFFAKRGAYEISRDAHRKLAYHWSTIPNTFDDVKEKAVREISRDIADLERYIKQQQARYDAWKAVK
jgi:hypothetical protein